MLHKDRKYTIDTVATAEELTEKLKEHTWCGCQGFRFVDTLWLNDSFGPDGAQEYTVFKGVNEIESITVSWCESSGLRDFIQSTVTDRPSARITYGRLRQDFDNHPEPCYLCR